MPPATPRRAFGHARYTPDAALLFAQQWASLSLKRRLALISRDDLPAPRISPSMPMRLISPRHFRDLLAYFTSAAIPAGFFSIARFARHAGQLRDCRFRHERQILSSRRYLLPSLRNIFWQIPGDEQEALTLDFEPTFTMTAPRQLDCRRRMRHIQRDTSARYFTLLSWRLSSLRFTLFATTSRCQNTGGFEVSAGRQYYSRRRRTRHYLSLTSRLEKGQKLMLSAGR